MTSRPQLRSTGAQAFVGRCPYETKGALLERQVALFFGMNFRGQEFCIRLVRPTNPVWSPRREQSGVEHLSYVRVGYLRFSLTPAAELINGDILFWPTFSIRARPDGEAICKLHNSRHPHCNIKPPFGRESADLPRTESILIYLFAKNPAPFLIKLQVDHWLKCHSVNTL